MERDPRVRRVAVAVAILSLAWFAGAPSAQELAELHGVVRDAAGQPAAGFRVVLRDVKTGAEYTSPPSGAAGEYLVRVLPGARYQIVAAVSSAGERLAVQPSAPVRVRVPGSHRLPDVRVVQGIPEAPETPVEEAAPPSPGKEPWYRKPPGIIAIVAGAAALTAALGDGEEEASPSSP